MDSNDLDEYFMSRAIDLGNQGKLTAPPNPWVGCVIVKNGKIIGEGYHHRAGEPHAEIIALTQAGKEAEGATVYLTLEPCAHQGRTPPCVFALIEAKIAKVVIALEDPDSRVQGKGILQLKAHGIKIRLGICQKKAHNSLESYLYQRKNHRPFCIAKAAITIDGRIAASDGSSKWISETSSREDAHLLRAESQAILIGAKTAMIDSPLLTVRHPTLQLHRQPLRVILDSKGIVFPKGDLFNVALAPTLVITSHLCHKDTLMAWKQTGVEVEVLPLINEKFDPKAILHLLNQREILQVLIEGGSSVITHFIEAQAIDKLVIYIGSKILGKTGISLFNDLGISRMSEAIPLLLEDVKVLQNNVRLDYRFSCFNRH